MHHLFISLAQISLTFRRKQNRRFVSLAEGHSKEGRLIRFGSFFFAQSNSTNRLAEAMACVKKGWPESSLLFIRRGADIYIYILTQMLICSDCLCERFVVVVVSSIFTTGIQSRWRRVSVEGLDRRDYGTVVLHFAEENVELLRSVYLADGLKVRHTWVC